MKPVPFAQRNSKTKRPFPLTDFNYRVVDIEKCNSLCGCTPRSSIRDIVREYFRTESRRDFWAEAIFFAAIALATIPALADNARALLTFVHRIVAN
jgi:hypothetical protein